jgi:hypothetical protein
MGLTSNQVKSILADIDAALAEVAKKHGLDSLRISGKASFDSDNFHVKITGVAQGGKDEAARRYEVNFCSYGWPPLKTSFTFNREEYTITGTNNTATNILAKNITNGQSYIFKVDGLQRLLQLQGKFAPPAASKGLHLHED